MIIIRASLILAMAICIPNLSCATSLLNTDSFSSDCGFSAYYETKEKNGEIEIIFSRITAEILNGHQNCGFGYVKTKVDRAEIDGAVLPERVEKDVYLYAAPNGFDPRKNIITILTGNNRYVSDLTSVKQTDHTYIIFLKPVS